MFPTARPVRRLPKLFAAIAFFSVAISGFADPAAVCIEACRRRFAAEPNLSYHVNDTCSLSMIPSGSIDFAFSFDSLVHVHREIVEAYVAELADKLTKHGIAFLHHSNLGE
jgi:hypothetical protein